MCVCTRACACVCLKEAMASFKEWHVILLLSPAPIDTEVLCMQAQTRTHKHTLVRGVRVAAEIIELNV